MREEGRTKHFRRRFTKLKSEFDTNWKSHFQDISDYLMPRKGRFLDRDTTPNDGGKRNSLIYDGTGTRALRILAAGMQSGLTSPARPWFRLGIPDKDLEEYPPVRTWLDEVEKRMLFILARSNFYSAVHSVYGELGAFGTSAMLIEEDFYNILRCYPFTIGEYFIATDSALRADTFYRKFPMTLTNIVNTFGEKNVSEYVLLESKKNGDKWHSIIHAIEPNTDRNINRSDNQNMPYTSIYFEDAISDDMDKVLRLSGYNMFPIMAPRWDTTGSEVYGRSPGMEVLPDVMMLQKEQEKKLKALDKLVDPPMNATPNMRDKAKTIISGGVTYVDNQQQGGSGFSPTYQIKPDFNAIRADIEDVRTAIKEGFYNDLFLMLALGGDKTMTAREVAERHEEKLLSVGPVVERLQPELLDRTIDRSFTVMMENRLLPEPPPELDRMPMEVEYIGLLAQAQKMVGMTSVEQVSTFAGNLSAVWPEARHKVDPLQAVDEFAKMAGAPAKMIVPDEDVIAKMEAENKAMQQKQQAEQMAVAAQGAKTLSEADLDKNNVLKALTGGVAA